MSTLWNPAHSPRACARSMRSNAVGCGGAPKGGGMNCACISATVIAPPSSRKSRSFAQRRRRRWPRRAASKSSSRKLASRAAARDAERGASSRDDVILDKNAGADRDRRRSSSSSPSSWWFSFSSRALPVAKPVVAKPAPPCAFLPALRRGRDVASRAPEARAGARMPIIRSKLRTVSRTEASALDAVDAFEPLSNHSCSFWTWQCGQSCAAFGGARAPAPAHFERTGASTRGRRRSRDVPSPATYVGVAEGARSGAAPAASSPGSSASSSTRYHRRAETHAHSTHAPPTMVRPEGAAVGVGVAAGFSASTAKRTATSRASSPDAAAASPATGADISDRSAVLASRPRDVSEGATDPCPRASRCASPGTFWLSKGATCNLLVSWPKLFLWRQTDARVRRFLRRAK